MTLILISSSSRKTKKSFAFVHIVCCSSGIHFHIVCVPHLHVKYIGFCWIIFNRLNDHINLKEGKHPSLEIPPNDTLISKSVSAKRKRSVRNIIQIVAGLINRFVETIQKIMQFENHQALFDDSNFFAPAYGIETLHTTISKLLVSVRVDGCGDLPLENTTAWTTAFFKNRQVIAWNWSNQIKTKQQMKETSVGNILTKVLKTCCDDDWMCCLMFISSEHISL